MKEYQFWASVSFDIEVEILKKDLQQWPDRWEGELEPNDEIMEKLEHRLTETAKAEFALAKRINLYTDGECLTAIKDWAGDVELPWIRFAHCLLLQQT